LKFNDVENSVSEDNGVKQLLKVVECMYHCNCFFGMNQHALLMIFVFSGSELTFNYHMDCFGGEKVRCRCNSSICSRYLGVRPKVPSRLFFMMDF